MSYNEWLNIIEILKKSNNTSLKNKLLKEELNINIKEMLEPKIINLIEYKFNILINRFINSLNEIFYDNNTLDFNLINLKKEIKFIYDLTYIKEISIENQKYLRKMLREEIKKIYNILLKEAKKEDITGVFVLTVKNNEIKWSD